MAHIAVLRAFWTDWSLRKLSSAHKTSSPGAPASGDDNVSAAVHVMMEVDGESGQRTLALDDAPFMPGFRPRLQHVIYVREQGGVECGML